MSDMLWLIAIFCGAYLGARMAGSPIGLLGELRDLALIPGVLWDALCGKPAPTDADIAHARAELEAAYRRAHGLE